MAQRVVDQTINPEELEKAEQEAKKRDELLAKQAAANDGSVEVEDTQSAKKKKTRGANYKKAKKSIDAGKEYSVEDAIKFVKKAKYTKFNETVDLQVNLGIDPRNSDQRIRFTVTLPHGTGKSVKLLVLSDDDSGAKENVLMRDESAIAEIVEGKLIPGKDFDMVICSPAKMKDLAKAARILGPKGMMPSPKAGTVTDKIDDAISNLSKGQMEIKNQSGHAVIHQSIGKVDFKDAELVANAEYLINEINSHNPGKLKQKFIQSIYVSSTMSPSAKVEVKVS